MLSMALASSFAISAVATERQSLELEERMVFNKIGAVERAVALPRFEPGIRDFEPEDIDTFRQKPFQNKSVSFSFPVANKMAMDFSEKQAHSQSRQYRMEVTGKQLRQGIKLNTTAPGALVRISGFNNNNAIEPQNLSLVVSDQKFAKGTAFDTLVDSRMMTKTGVGFQRGTTGFKISEQVGKGAFKLQTQQQVADGDRYLVNVFEKNSDLELHLTANKSNYLKGHSMNIKSALWFDGKKLPFNALQSRLISPTGEKFKVLANKSGQMQLPLNMNASRVPGALWTLETEAEAMVDGQMVKRIAKVAFSFADKTANLSKMQPLVTVRGDNLSTAIPVNVKRLGRYEVRGVLYGTNSYGKLVPVMVTHAASDLTPGMGVINMQFDQKILSATGLKAPFAIRNIQLRDQKQMALLEAK